MTLDTYADLFDDDLDAIGISLNQARSEAGVLKTCSENPNSALALIEKSPSPA